MESGQLLNREEMVVNPRTGETRWLQTTKVPLRDKAGKVVGLMGINRDITDRKQAEEALRRSRNELEKKVAERTAELSHERLLLRTLIDNLPDGIYAKDTAGRKTPANPADLKVMGCKTETDAVGKSDFDFFPKDIAEKFWADDQKVIEGQPVINREEYFFDGEGQKRWLLTSKLPLHDQNGTIVGLVGIGRDITDRKLTEAKLAHERDLLNTLMDNTPDLFYFKDLQSRFVRVSKSTLKYSFESALERHRSSRQSPDAGELPPHLSSLEEFKKYLIGKTDFDVLDEERARSTYNDEQEIIRTGQPIIGKLRRTTMPDGTVGWRITNKMPWRDKDGKIIGTFGTGRDITAIKEAEAKLEQTHKQLLETSRQAGMAEVATSVLHNVGNVLNSVNVASSCLADSLRNSKVTNLSKIVALLSEHEADLGHFITSDPKGKQLPG